MIKVLFHLPTYKNFSGAVAAVNAIVDSTEYAIEKGAALTVGIYVTFSGTEEEFILLTDAVSYAHGKSHLTLDCIKNSGIPSAIENWNKFADRLAGFNYYIPNHSDNLIEKSYLFELNKIALCVDDSVIVPSHIATRGDTEGWLKNGDVSVSFGAVCAGVFSKKYNIPIECAYPVKVIKKENISYQKLGQIAWASDLVFFLEVARQSRQTVFADGVITRFTLANDGGITKLSTQQEQRRSLVAAAIYCLRNSMARASLIFLRQYVGSFLLKSA